MRWLTAALAALRLAGALATCPPGWILAGGRCFGLLGASTPFRFCQDQCASAVSGGRHACIESAAQNDAIASGLLSGTDRERCCSWYSQSCCVFLGLYQSPTDAGPRVGWDNWAGGSCASSFRNWYPGQPGDEGDENCAMLGFTAVGDVGNWHDYSCALSADCLCDAPAGPPGPPSRPLIAPPPPPPLRGALECPLVYNSERLAWADAEAHCVSLGGHLATIPSLAVNEYIVKKFVRPEGECAANGVWIGYSDADDEGQWRWADGSAGDFTNWWTEEPNDYGRGEDCAALGVDCLYGFEGVGAKWADAGCNADGYEFHARPSVCQLRRIGDGECVLQAAGADGDPQLRGKCTTEGMPEMPYPDAVRRMAEECYCVAPEVFTGACQLEIDESPSTHDSNCAPSVEAAWCMSDACLDFGRFYATQHGWSDGEYDDFLEDGLECGAYEEDEGEGCDRGGSSAPAAWTLFTLSLLANFGLGGFLYYQRHLLRPLTRPAGRAQVSSSRSAIATPMITPYVAPDAVPVPLGSAAPPVVVTATPVAGVEARPTADAL